MCLRENGLGESDMVGKAFTFLLIRRISDDDCEMNHPPSTKSNSPAVNLDESLYARIDVTPMRHSPTSPYTGERVTASAGDGNKDDGSRVCQGWLSTVDASAVDAPLTDSLHLSAAGNIKPAQKTVDNGDEYASKEESGQGNRDGNDNGGCRKEFQDEEHGLCWNFLVDRLHVFGQAIHNSADRGLVVEAD